MKRKLICIISLLLIAVMMAVPVLAAKSVSVTLKADSTTVNSGDKVTITVSASVDTCGSGGIELSYDTKVFELVSGEWLLSGTALADFSTSTKDGVFALNSDSAISGSAFKFVLKVKDSAALGSSNVSVCFTADGISATKAIGITVACAHKYDNSCDTTCNLCKATRTISHTWNSGKVTKAATCTATGTKTYTCTVCSATKTEEVAKTSHSYDNNCDTDCNNCGKTRSITHDYKSLFDETVHWEKCSVCGDTLASEAHTFAEELSSNSSSHGYVCTVCGAMSGEEAHAFENDCDTTCDICGYERTITHSYSERWISDADGHWHECTVCGDQLEKVVHTPGEEATETTDQICVDCGYLLQVAGNHEHTMAGDWLSDDAGHWFLCTCGVYTDPEEHVLGEAVIDEENSLITYHCTVCGHEWSEEYVAPTTEPTTEPTEVTEPVETTQPTQPQTPSEPGLFSGLFEGFPWWIVAAVLAVLLLISIIFNVYLLRCLFASKKTGKYAKKEYIEEVPVKAPAVQEETPAEPEQTPNEQEQTTDESDAPAQPEE